MPRLPWPARSRRVGELQRRVTRLNKSLPHETIVDAVRLAVSEVSGLPATGIASDATLAELGFDSLTLASLGGELNDRLGLRLPADVLVGSASIDALAGAVASTLAAKPQIRNTPNSLPDGDFPEFQSLDRRLARMAEAGIVNPFHVSLVPLPGGRATVGNDVCLNFSSYDYLGLAHDPTVIAAAHEALDRFGTSASASRVAGGERSVHHKLETEIASFLGTEEALVFASGYGTGVSVVGHLLSSTDLILHDESIHNSLMLGSRLSGAARLSFAHNDAASALRLLEARRTDHARALLIIEGIYSADGDIPSLPDFAELRRKYRALLMVDEAHSVGVLGRTGRGVGEHFGVPPEEVDIWMGTLSKSLAGSGGYIAGRSDLIGYLRNTCPGYVFSAGLPPVIAASALAALRVLRAEPERVRKLQSLAALFRTALRAQGVHPLGNDGVPVVPLPAGSAQDAFRWSHKLRRDRILVHPLVPPAVPEGSSRLRFFISCDHSEEDLRRTAVAIGQTSPTGRR